MPFVRKTGSQGSQPPTDTRKLFIGRTGELLFFVQNILKPEEPTHNIISIWGQGGVGKSTLLSRFIDEARSANFKDYCLTATVDELQTTPASMMEKFASQLHMQGAFEKALKHYKKVLRTQQTEREMMQDTLLQRTPTLAGAALEGVPFVGPLLGEGVKATAEHLLDRNNDVQKRKDEELFEDPVNVLTRAFVDELNRITDTQVLLSSGRVMYRKVLLFFDTFEQLATAAVPWFLNYFLLADIKSNIVLIIAGRDPIERSSITDNTKRWLPYIDNETIYWIPLNSFTEDETRAYLIKRNITDPERITTIWQLSQGLPLYLSLLTSNPQGKVDPAADVVANFLRWIPENEQVKRQLALDTSLFSKPFSQDDLAAFAYLPEQERIDLYYWLTGLSFVYPQEGRFRYHELAQDLFSRHLYQRSKKDYYATRKSIVHYYQRLLEEIQGERGLEANHSMEWLELVLALTAQLFSLPDEASHVNAVELIMTSFRHTDAEQNGEIANFLRELSEKKTNIQISTDALQITKHLLQYIEADARSQERLTAANALLEKVELLPSFSPDARVQIYSDRGWAYLRLKEYEQAINDYNSALALKPEYAWAYGSRGLVYRALNNFQQALADFNHAIELNPKYAWAYGSRGQTYHLLKDNQRALADFGRAIELNPQYTWAFEQRGRVYRKLKNYQQALEDFDHAVELDPNYVWAYVHRGITYRILKDNQRALADFDRALELEPHNAAILVQSGLTCLWMRDTRRAAIDYAHSWEIDSKYLHNGWMTIWSGMCNEIPDLEVIERLEIIATTDPENPVAFVCRGVVKWLRRNFEEALQELEQAIQMAPEEWDAHFWKGMAYASLGREEEAIAAVEQSLDLELPSILLTPLRWFKQDKLDFYQKYVVPLMARYDLVG
jgi:tetratricopeptide (TPR) repeat protein